jgi:hypothetical protein
LGIDDFDFLLEAACGADSWTWGTAGGGVSRAGTAKVALQAGHSMVWPASSSGISKRWLQFEQGIFILNLV